MSQQIRPPAVAGLFYPARDSTLAREVERMLAPLEPAERRPRALIAPHAGYIYSGPIAASAYAQLRPFHDAVDRVVLLGPSHYVPFRGLSLADATAFDTPLGQIEVDVEACHQLSRLPQVVRLDAAHGREHSLEVHLPFLQTVLDAFRLVPLAVGEATSQEVAEVLLPYLDVERTLVVSSDLSHYQDYETARRLDQETCRRIESLSTGGVAPESACGSQAVNGLLEAARRLGLEAATLDLRNSGDTAGQRDSVVGYGAWAFYTAQSSRA